MVYDRRSVTVKIAPALPRQQARADPRMIAFPAPKGDAGAA
jgi:hypothetical protein